MSIKPFKVPVHDLTIGMYVSGLDRPWRQTPFPLQGFYILDIKEVETIQQHCRFVYIDVLKGSGPTPKKKHRLTATPPAARTSSSPVKRALSFTHKAVANARRPEGHYPTPKPLSQEVKRIKKIQDDVFSSLDKLTHCLTKERTLAITDVKQKVKGLVGSVVRNPCALTWLSRLQDKHRETHAHSFRAAVITLVFARHLALKERELEQLGLAVLLKDIGKTQLSREIIERNKNTAHPDNEYQSFVNHSTAIIQGFDNIHKNIVRIVATHQEGIDGSGFPARLTAKEIPLLGQIAGLCSHYDELVNTQSQQQFSPSKALSVLFAQRGKRFDGYLVDEFIKAIGTYPSGTFVSLNTGEIAVVVEQNEAARLHPRVLILTDTAQKPLNKMPILDLKKNNANSKKSVCHITTDIKSTKLSTSLINRYNNYTQQLMNQKISLGHLLGMFNLSYNI